MLAFGSGIQIHLDFFLHWSTGFLGGSSGKEAACQCRRHKTHGFDPWVWKITWRRAWQPTPVSLPGESPWTEEPGGLVHRVAKSWECLRTHTHRYRKRYTNHNLWLNLMNYYKMKHFNVIIHIRNWTLFNIQYSRCLSYAPTHSPCPSFFLEAVMKKIQTLWSSLRRLRTWWAMSSACHLSVQNL